MKRALFLLGLHLLCLSVLVQQIALTRVLSVMTYFHLAFISISMAMLGLTAGSVWVYLKGYRADDLARLLPGYTRAYALASVLAVFFICSTYVPATGGMNDFAALFKIVCCMAVPYLLAGIAIALCLTRGDQNGAIGLRYAADLTGAALGCLLCIPLMSRLDGPYTLVAAAGIALVSGLCFLFALTPAGKPRLRSAAVTAGLLLGLLVLVAGQRSPTLGLRVPSFKSPDLVTHSVSFERWNSFSNIRVSAPFDRTLFYWGPGDDAPDGEVGQRYMAIDGMAGTPMSRFEGDYATLGSLRYDVTNLAYAVRHQGRSAVIGVGGGRDVMAARHFGFGDVTAVELNPIIVDLLTRTEPYASYAGLKQDPALHFHVDDGRSWFARTTDRFDLIQMSMIDTFAATGAGGFTLSENGLYTVEGWRHFLGALTPTGVFTVSRWYSPKNLNETGRVISLALASLWSLGVPDARRHLYLAGTDRLATMLVARAPLTEAELARLDEECAARGYQVLLHPTRPPPPGLLTSLVQFTDLDALNAFAGGQLLDMSAPTDARPFFFNQLRLFHLSSLSEALAQEGDGVVLGNLRATLGLLFVVLVSALAILFVLLVPTLRSVKDVDRAYARAGTAYFLLIGVGFMFVEIALIQRTSLFLGHPTYGLAIALFSLILATGLGSLLSGALGLTRSLGRLRAFPVLTFALLLATALAGPRLMATYESASITVRGLIAVLLTAPPALLMGFGFPLGMTLAEKIDGKPTPWFWSVNGAAGVLASGLAVILSMNFSIPVTLGLGALCYLALLGPVRTLHRLGG